MDSGKIAYDEQQQLEQNSSGNTVDGDGLRQEIDDGQLDGNKVDSPANLMVLLSELGATVTTATLDSSLSLTGSFNTGGFESSVEARVESRAIVGSCLTSQFYSSVTLSQS
nr:hypothetical protein Itr_chr12CG16380 [Ipomoea trifida]GLL44262.1 hypothetical protein Itr_chr13CG08580 [Ipomoea trifida]